MNAWNKDRKGNELHEGDRVRFSLRAFASQAARDTLNGRTANIRLLIPGMPYRAVLTNVDPVAKEFLKAHNTREIPCDHLVLED